MIDTSRQLAQITGFTWGNSQLSHDVTVVGNFVVLLVVDGLLDFLVLLIELLLCVLVRHLCDLVYLFMPRSSCETENSIKLCVRHKHQSSLTNLILNKTHYH